ncbi:MAG: hypothetical protein HFJ47_00885 [Clostridia bacterium]|nr:hypothetical protein [Clostridia bacterium]
MNGEIRIQTVKVTDVIVGIDGMDGMFIELILDEINRPSRITWRLKFQLKYFGETKIKKLMEYTEADIANFNNLKDKIFKIVAMYTLHYDIYGFGHYDFDKFTPMYTRDSFDVTLSDLEELIRKM